MDFRKDHQRHNFGRNQRPQFGPQTFPMFPKPERVIVGTSNDKSKKVMEQLYEAFVRTGNPVYFMDEKSAELTKYAANSFLATKITFINEIAKWLILSI